MKRMLVLVFGMALITTVALGHENEQHVMGTVTKVSDSSVTVRTAAKEPKTITVVITTQTQFVKSELPATLNDLKVGERVVVHTKENGEKLEATRVAFGKSSQTRKKL